METGLTGLFSSGNNTNLAVVPGRFEVATRLGAMSPGLSVGSGPGPRLLEMIFQEVLVVQETVFSGAVREPVQVE